MNFFGGGKVGGGSDDRADTGRGKSALPPPCPRCEQTKSQFVKTMQNYKRAYAKKLDSARTDLSKTRAENEKMRRENRRLRSSWHLPTLALGVVIGALAKPAYKFAAKHAKQLWERLQEELEKRHGEPEAEEEEDGSQEGAAAQQ